MRIGALALLVWLGCSSQGSAQLRHSIELSGSAGYTLINIEEVVVKDEVRGTTANDWSYVNWGIGAQYFYMTKVRIGIGAEVMYQHLYWYEVHVPYGSYGFYRSYDVGATRVATIVRFFADSIVSLDLGPELNVMDGVHPGAMISANLNIPVTKHFQIPFKVRADIFKNIEPLIPLSLSLGPRVRF